MAVTVMARLKRLYCLTCKSSTYHRDNECGVCGTSKFVRL